MDSPVVPSFPKVEEPVVPAVVSRLLLFPPKVLLPTVEPGAMVLEELEVCSSMFLVLLPDSLSLL
jgi:hypothetical protein